MRQGGILLCCVFAVSAQRLPKFSDYRESRYSGAGVPPNFAGHYELSTGACPKLERQIKLTITEVVTGVVRDGGCYWWGYGAYGRKDLPYGVKYRVNSSLLIVSGCRDAPDPACATFYYRFKDGELLFVRMIPFKPPIAIE
jgi:hypothetical protein